MHQDSSDAARQAPQRSPARIVVLISGTGRNLQAIIDACAAGRINGSVVGVVSNRPGVLGLERAQSAGIETRAVDHTTFDTREAFDAVLAQTVEAFSPSVIALAGFMRILTPGFINRFAGKLVNIHPSLLPKYRGLNTHARAIEAGDAEAGASVHYVTAELDDGPVILQRKLPILPDDTPDSLAERVMREIELDLYPAALEKITT